MDVSFVTSSDCEATPTEIDNLHDAAWVLLIEGIKTPLGSIVKTMEDIQGKISELWSPFMIAAADASLSAEAGQAAAGASDAPPTQAVAAATVAPPEKGVSLFTSMSIMAAGSTPEGAKQTYIEGNASVLNLFKLQLQCFLASKFSSGFGAQADCGYHSLHEVPTGNGKSKNLVFNCACHKQLRLTFFGEIVSEATSGCLPICNCFGKEWFVKAPPLNTFHDAAHNYTVPAWNVPTIKSKEQPTVKWTVSEPDTHQFEFSFCPSNCKNTRHCTVGLQICTLTLADEYKGDVVLLRDAMPAMVKTVRASQKRVSTSALPAKWRPFLHLLQ